MDTPELIPCKPFLQSISRHPEIWSTNSSSGERRRVAAAWKQVCLDTWPADFDSWTADQKQKRCLALQKKWKTIHTEFMNAQENGNSNRTLVAYKHMLSFLVAAKKRRRLCGCGATYTNAQLYERTLADNGGPGFFKQDVWLDISANVFAPHLGQHNESIRNKISRGKGKLDHDTKSAERRVLVIALEGPVVQESAGSAERARSTSRSRSRSRSRSPEDRHFMLSLVSHMREVPRASKLALREDMLRLVRKYTPQHQSDQTFDHS